MTKSRSLRKVKCCRSHDANACAPNPVLHDSISHVPDGMAVAFFAMGCFWGVERLFWQQPGVYSTAAGYSGGYTPNPTYREVCSGQTGHAETVRVVFDPQIVAYTALLRLFWENHDPTQGMRQGGDIGTQYRSALFPQDDAQQEAARASLAAFAQAMADAGDTRSITVALEPAVPFYYAENEHQQYLHKHPDGYSTLGGIGVCLPPAR